MNKIKKILATVVSSFLIGGAVGCTSFSSDEPLELTTPSIKLNENVVTWDAVEKAEGYIVLCNDVESQIASTTYTINATKYGDYTVKVKAYANDKETLVYSDFSNVVTYHEDLTLSAPVIALNQKVVSWTAVANATKYEVFVNGTSKGEQTATSYTITETAFGDYKVTVKAIGMDGVTKITSNASNEVTCHVDLVLSAPVIALNQKVVSWTAVANATKYEIFVNGTSKGEQTATSYTVNETAFGDYKVTVKAIGMDGSIKVTSAASNEVTYHVALVLGAPVIALNQKVVSWTAVANATKYEVFVNGTSKGEQTASSYTITETAFGDYKVTVKAIGMDGTNKVTSAASNEVTYHVALVLSAPAIALNQNVVSWTAVANATKYEVFVNGTSKGEQTATSYTINETVVGDYKVTVKAIGMDGTTKVTSAASNEVEYSIVDPKLISSKNVAYDEIPLEWYGAGVMGEGYHMCTNTADTFFIETKAPILVSENVFKFTAIALGHPNDFKVYAKTAGEDYAQVGSLATIPNDGYTHQLCFDFNKYLGKFVSIKIEAIRHPDQAYISVALQTIGFAQESTKISGISTWEIGDIFQDWDFDAISRSFPSGYTYGLPMPRANQSISNKIKLGNNQSAIKVNTYGKDQSLIMYVNDVVSTLPKTVDKDGVIYNLTAYAGQEITVKFVAPHDISICSIELISMPVASNYYSQNTEWQGGGAIGQGYHMYSATENMLVAETKAPIFASGDYFKLAALGLGTISSHKVYAKTADSEYALIRAVGASTDEITLTGANQVYQYAYDFSAYAGQYVSIKIEAIKVEGQDNISTAFNMGFASKDNEVSKLTSWGYENVFTDWEYTVINMVGGPSGDMVCYPCICPGQEISNKINVTSEYNAIKVVGVAPQLLTLYVNGIESTAAKVYDSNACYYNLADYVGQEVTVKFVGQNATIYSMSLDKMPSTWNYDTFASTWTGGYAIGQGYQLYHATEETVTIQTSASVLVSGNTFKFSALGLGVINSLKVYVKTAEGDFTVVRANGASEDAIVLPEANREYQYSYDFSSYVGQNVTIKIEGNKEDASCVSTALGAMGFTSDANKNSWNYGEVFVDWSFDTCMLAGSETEGDPRCYLVLDANQTMARTVKVTTEHHLLKLPETANVSLTVDGVDVGFVNINGFDVFDLSNYIGCEVNLVIKGVSYSRIISISLA